MYEKIRALAREKGISIPNLEKAVGLSNGTIDNWDKSIPSALNLRKVAHFLNVSMEYLLDASDYKKAGE